MDEDKQKRIQVRLILYSKYTCELALTTYHTLIKQKRDEAFEKRLKNDPVYTFKPQVNIDPKLRVSCYNRKIADLIQENVISCSCFRVSWEPLKSAKKKIWKNVGNVFRTMRN